MIHNATRSWRQYCARGVSFNNGLIWYQPVPTDVQGTRTFQLLSSTVVSVNSPGWWKKVKMIVVFKPAKNRRIPTDPLWPLPPLVAPIPVPVRRPKQSLRSWRKVMSRYQKREALRQLKVTRLHALYKIRLAKYYKRKAFYAKYLNKVKNGVERVRRVRVKSANLKLNPYTKTTEYFSGSSGVLNNHMVACDKLLNRGRSVTYYTGDISHFSSQMAGFTRVADVSLAQTRALASAESRATGKLHEKLTEQSVHIANLVAERAQTYDLLSGAVRRLAAFLKSTRPVNIGKTLKDLFGSKAGHKKLADDTLAGLFGVVPLISDVKGAAETLARYNTEDIHSAVHVRARASSTESIFSSVETIQTLDKGNSVTEVRTVVEVEVRYVLQYRVANAMLSELQKLGLTNPMEIAWESMPWSFVVDWVLPIGNWIRSLSSEAGLVFEGGVKTVYTKTTQTFSTSYTGKEPVNMSKLQVNYWLDGRVSSQRVKTEHKRTVLSKAPSLQFPDFKSPVSILHIIESLALIRQLKG